MSLICYKENLLDAILGLLWRQWSALGVMGYEESGSTDDLLDPEALLLFSAGFCRYDQRLYDLVADWLQTYGKLVNPTRLKALLRKSKGVDTASLAYLAALCERAGDRRWTRFVEKRSNTAPEQAKPLFFHKDGSPVTYCPDTDALALSFGYTRNTYKQQKKLRPHLPENNATLHLRCRALIGVSSRAEVILKLAMEPSTLQQLSDYSGFARSAVKDVLDELALTRMVSQVEGSIRNSVYVLTPAAELKQLLLQTGPCRVIRWMNIYNALLSCWQFVSNPVLLRLSEDTIHGEITQLFRSKLQPAFINCGIGSLHAATPDSFRNLPFILSQI